MRIAHTSITVKAIEASINFYCDVLELRLVRRRKIPENNAEVAFLADEISDVMIELTYWSEKKDWIEGDELDHIGFIVPNMDEAMQRFKDKNVEIAMEPFSLKGSSTKIAFIRDPNGIWLEIIEKKV